MENRRKRLFVREGDHWGLLGGVAVLIVILSLVAGALFYFIANRDLEHTAYRAHFEILRNTMQMLLPWLILVNLASIIIVLILAVSFTHRISGPAYHIIKDLRRMRDGDLTVSTNFRKGDRLKDVAVAMQDATIRLRDDVDLLKKELSQLSLEADNYPEIKKRTSKLLEILNRLKT